jgi:hypothetical protein
LNTIDTRINGVRVVITEKTATQSALLLARIVKYFGSGIIKIIDNFKHLASSGGEISNVTALLDSNVTLDGFVDAINDISDKIDPEIFVNLLQEISGGAKIQHPVNSGEMMEVNNDTFDAIFTGRTKLMYQVVFFVLKVNFGDFFKVGDSGIIPTPPVSPPMGKKNVSKN